MVERPRDTVSKMYLLSERAYDLSHTLLYFQKNSSKRLGIFVKVSFVMIRDKLLKFKSNIYQFFSRVMTYRRYLIIKNIFSPNNKGICSTVRAHKVSH